MADNKVLNARIKQKCDTLENWSNNNPVLLAGELAVVKIDTTDPANKQLPPIMFKIGDGATRFNSLGWASAKAADVYDWAKTATKPKYTASEVGAATPSDVSEALESAKDYADKNFLKTSGGNTIDGSLTVTGTIDAKKITVDGKDITVLDSYATKDALTAETTARTNADTALESSISALSDNLTDYKTDNNAALKTTTDNLNTHIADKNNPHGVTKTQVGLSDVVNERQYSANNPNFGTDTPLMDGTAAVGTKATYSRSDHVHPSDISKLNKTDNTDVSVLEETKDTTTLGGNQLVAPKGIIFGGTAAAAGLVTRGICGVTTPSSNGSCSKENLYLNYDGNNNFNSNRQVIVNAGTVGSPLGLNMYQYALPRGEIVKNWVEAKGYATTTYVDTQVGEAKTIAEAAQTEASTNASEIEKIKDGTTKVKKAETADNATKLNNQSADYYTNYTNATNKPKLDTTATASQATSATEEISGTIKLHKISKTGKFDDLIDSPVHQTDIVGEDGLNNPMYNECGLYSVPVTISYSPFDLKSLHNTTGSAPDRMWLTVTEAQETDDVSQGLSTITQRIAYSDKVAVRTYTYKESKPTALQWENNWSIYDLSQINSIKTENKTVITGTNFNSTTRDFTFTTETVKVVK